MPILGSSMPNYVAASVALSIGGLINGYDTGSIGAIVHMSQFASSMGALSSFMTGITVSMIMLTGVVPSFFTGQLADRYGRLKIIGPGALVFAAGAVLQASSTRLVQFVLGRAVAGLGQGIFLGNISVYITEIAPLSRRGRLAALPQFMATLGICVGYFFCYGTAGLNGALAWRVPYILQIAFSVSLAVTCRWLPESPRWLALHGRADAAIAALSKLDIDIDEARRDFLTTAQDQPSLSHYQSFALLFRRGYRPQTFLGLFVLSMVQLSGIDAITYYAPALFSQAGISSDKSSLVASGVSSITMLLVSIPAFMLADKWGRRTSTVTGGLLLAGIMVLIGSLYAAGAVQPHSAANWVVVVSVFLFGMVFCATWGIVGKIYASEIQPGNTRGAANSIGMAFSYFTNWLVALITPILLNASAFGAYFLFGGLALVGVTVLAAYMPETRARSLEDIQTDFQRPAKNMLLGLVSRHRARAHGSSVHSSPSPDTVSGGSDAASIELQSDPAIASVSSSIAVESAARGYRVGTT